MSKSSEKVVERLLVTLRHLVNIFEKAKPGSVLSRNLVRRSGTSEGSRQRDDRSGLPPAGTLLRL